MADGQIGADVVVRVQRSLPVTPRRYTEIIRDLQSLAPPLVICNSVIFAHHAYKHRTLFFHWPVTIIFRPRSSNFLKHCVNCSTCDYVVRKSADVGSVVFVKSENRMKFEGKEKRTWRILFRNSLNLKV